MVHIVDLRWCAELSSLMVDDELALQRQLLAAALVRHRVALHAYALMPARTLLLLTPESAEGLARLVQDLGRRLAAEMRRRHGHRGPVMAGRFRSTIVQPELHLLPAMQFVEQAPVRGGIPAGAELGSSARMHCGGVTDPLVTDHPVYWSTGNTPFEREARHRERLAEPLPSDALRRFEGSLAGGWPIGDERFLAGLAQQLGRRVVPRAAGRPKRSTGSKVSPII